jgi:hypothetical protein
VKDIPVICSAPMVLALIEDRKIMTRRLAWRDAAFGLQDYSSEQLEDIDARGWSAVGEGDAGLYRVLKPTPWQKVTPGDRLWVKEVFCYGPADENPIYYRATDQVQTVQDGDGFAVVNKDGSEKSPWRSPLHMPRYASRLTLIVTATRIERLQEISEADVFAEGLRKLSKDAAGQEARGLSPTWKFGLAESDGLPGPKGWPWHEWRISPVDAFEKLWTSLHGPDSWKQNPEVVAVSFEVRKANIDTLPKAIAA